MKSLGPLEVWFVAGSQEMYGSAALRSRIVRLEESRVGAIDRQESEPRAHRGRT